jgi:hydroxymethylpyrimidine pyrophosphatase-like HAD family hydrolase
VVRYAVLAAGFDGTLACDGRYDQRGIAALRALAASGRKLILATSRELRDLLDIFPEVRLFDYVVAENGAVLHCPAVRESAILAQAPSELLIHALRRRGVQPLSIGSVGVTTGGSAREAVISEIENLRLDCQVIDNGRTLAVMPAGVNKASGVSIALEELGLSPRNLIAIGDAENDAALLELAEHGVAVANAAPMLKRLADRVTRAAYADGVQELVLDLLESDRTDTPAAHAIA